MEVGGANPGGLPNAKSTTPFEELTFLSPAVIGKRRYQNAPPKIVRSTQLYQGLSGQSRKRIKGRFDLTDTKVRSNP